MHLLNCTWVSDGAQDNMKWEKINTAMVDETMNLWRWSGNMRGSKRCHVAFLNIDWQKKSFKMELPHSERCFYLILHQFHVWMDQVSTPYTYMAPKKTLNNTPKVQGNPEWNWHNNLLGRKKAMGDMTTNILTPAPSLSKPFWSSSGSLMFQLALRQKQASLATTGSASRYSRRFRS